MTATKMIKSIKAVLFDFGGVLAEEGFRKGFEEIASQNGMNPGFLYELAVEIIFKSGYITGRAGEADFWQMIRKRSSLRGKSNTMYREKILRQFILRPKMITIVRKVKQFGLLTAILSDQTDWLDRLDERDHFFGEFDHIFNSYHLGKSKRDITLFEDVIDFLNITPIKAIFIDNDSGNIERAACCGLRTILYCGYDNFIRELNTITGFCVA